MLDQPEYYTGLTGRRLHQIVVNLTTTVSPETWRKFDREVYESLRPEWMDAQPAKETTLDV